MDAKTAISCRGPGPARNKVRGTPTVVGRRRRKKKTRRCALAAKKRAKLTQWEHVKCTRNGMCLGRR